MDQNKIVEALRATLEPTQREQAEAFLTEVQKIINFVPQLLSLVMRPDVDGAVRQAGAIYMKNMINQHWEEPEELKAGVSVPFSIHESDKQVIRDNIVEAVITQQNPIRSQLAVCVNVLVKNDYPGKWPGIAEKILTYLSSDKPEAYLGATICLYQLVKNFEYKKPSDRTTLNELMIHVLPVIYRLGSQLVSDQSEASTILLKQIFKVYFALVQFSLPLNLISHEMFTQWMDLARRIIEAPLPQCCVETDPDEQGALVWWKCKKWAAHLMTRCFDRYGSPGTVLKEYEEFSKWFLKTFAVGCLQVMMKLLERYVNKEFVSQRVLQLILQFISHGVKHAVTWKHMKPHVQVIVEKVIFPLFGLSDEDEELWKDDPIEFIKVKYDIYEEFFSPTTAAESLLVDIVSKRKETLQMVMNWSVASLNTEDARVKDQALHMIGVLSEVLLKKKLYRDQIEQMLVLHVFPHFNSPLGFLRARACWMISMFGKLNFKQPVNLQLIIQSTITLLHHDSELPVKVEAAIALQRILGEQDDKAKDLLAPNVPQIFKDLLQLIRETENDNVATCLQNFVFSFVEEVKPLAVELTSHLAETFARLLESSASSSEDKSIMAMGLLNSLETICRVMEDYKEILQSMEGIIIEVIKVILKNNVSEYFEEMLSLIYSLTTAQITPQMWTALPIIYDLFKLEGNIDYFTEMMPALHNYITVDPMAFLAESSRMEIIYDMAKQVLNGTLGDAGEDAESHAAKLLEVMLLQFKDIPELLCKMMPLFIELALSRLSRKITTTELRTMCLQVVLAAIFCNPSLALTYLTDRHLPSSDETMIRQFLKQLINDTDCFLGLHDRKMFVLGLSTLMSLPSNVRPANIEDLASQLLPSLIIVFKGLKRAYECLSQEEDEEEEGGDDDEIEVEDDDDVIDNDEEEYIERMEKAGNDDEDDEDDYDDDDEQTLLESYETSVDKEESPLDEYQMFRTVVEGIRSIDGQWYQLLTQSLSEEDKKELDDIFRLAEQKRAARESKKIEQAGGYNFTVTQVPSSFCFGGGVPPS